MGNLFGKVPKFLHSGALGDVIYSLPLVRAMDGGYLYLKKENEYHKGSNFYEMLKRLLEEQKYIKGVIEYPNTNIGQYHRDINITHDLDCFRKHPKVLSQNMASVYFDSFGLEYPGHEIPWLRVKKPRKEFEGYAVINRTFKYKTQFDWKKLHNEIVANFVDKVVFLGTKEEYLHYIQNIGFCKWEPTADILEVAQIISSCAEVYCNQSVCLTIAQSLGKIYNLEVADGHDNCIYLTDNEHLLNRWTVLQPQMDIAT